MTLTHYNWAGAVDGKYVDIDGVYGGQCWDTFADYCISVLGIEPINTYGGNWSGWAYAIWDQYEVNGAAKYFDKIPATSLAREGDIAIWTDQYWYYPASHIAVVLNDWGSDLECMSQNSSPARPWQGGYSADATGPNIRQRLTKNGLAGYLRFRRIELAAPAIKLPPVEYKEWDEMASKAEIEEIFNRKLDEKLRQFQVGIPGKRSNGETYDALEKTIDKVIKYIQAVADVDRSYIPDKVAELEREGK